MNGPVNYYDGFSQNGNGGLRVLSRGAVTISKAIVKENGIFGALINNVPSGILAGVPVTISDSFFTSNSPFGGAGLKVLSKGLITLTNIQANNNGGEGVYLDNKTSGGVAGITINASVGKGNQFQGNKFSGLYILTNGAVSLTNIYSVNNWTEDLNTGGTQDFSITTRLLLKPDANYQFAGLVLFQDNENYMQFGRAFCDSPECVGEGIYFDQVLNYEFGPDNFAVPFTLTDVFLKLDRVGDLVTAFYSTDGTVWDFVGTHTLPEGFRINGVGLTGSQDSSKSVPDKAADFNFFGISDPVFERLNSPIRCWIAAGSG